MDETPTGAPKAASSNSDYLDQWKARNHKIKVLIIATEDYVVHVNTEGNVEWGTTPEYDAAILENKAYDSSKLNAILLEAARLEVIPCEGLTEKGKIEFKRLLGEAHAFAFALDYKSAGKMIVAAEQYITARCEETSRVWYLTASSYATIPFLILGSLVWIFRGRYAEFVGAEVLWLTIATSAGAVGALFSVIARTGHLKLDCSAGWNLHQWEASSRIVAGAISGLLVALAVRSEVILGPLAGGGRLHLIMILAALAAGAGERLATSIISKFDTPNTRTRSRGNGVEL
jgi:hypothetical protein